VRRRTIRFVIYIVNYFLCVGRCIQAVLLVKQLAQKTSMHALSAENLLHN